MDIENLPLVVPNELFTEEIDTYTITSQDSGILITWKPDRIIPITSHTIEDYYANLKIERNIWEKAVVKNPQVFEVGPGLSEFLPAYAEFAQENGLKKPIVVDPCDFNVLGELLGRAKQKRLNNDTRTFIDKLTKRIEILTDPMFVAWIQLPVERLRKRYPQLKGKADIVIDCVGGLYYSTNLQEALLVESEWLRNPNSDFLYRF